MRIEIDKILTYELKDKHYLSDYLLRFKLESGDLFSQKLATYKKQAGDADDKFLPHLEKEYLTKRYNRFGTRDELMEKNLNHVFNADYYYTNGQKIVTMIIREDGYEIGIHNNIDLFARNFFLNHLFSYFSLSDLKLDSYEVFNFAEAQIAFILSELTIKRVPTLHDSNMDYLDVFEYYPYETAFRYGNKEIKKSHSLIYSMDEISLDIIKWLRPVVLKCCRNCKHFEYSGMALEAGGNAGYCKMSYNQLLEKSVGQSLTNVWNWCEKFEQNGKL